MTLSRRNWLTLATALLAVASAGPSFAASKTIKVSLWDKGPNSMSMLGKGEPMGMGMAGGMGAGHMGDGMQKGPMGITFQHTPWRQAT